MSDKEIESLCREAEASIPHISKGFVYYPMGGGEEKEHYEKATKAIEKAFELSNRKFADVWRVSGMLSDQLGKHDSALQDFEKAYELDPNNWKVLYSLSNYYSSRDPTKSFEFMIKAGEQKPEDEKFWIKLSNMVNDKLSSKNILLPKALDIHLKFLEIFPKHKLALKSIGDIFFSQKKYLEAIEYYQRYGALYKVGDCYRELGEVEAAISAYEQTFKRSRGSSDLKKALFELYTLQGFQLNSEADVSEFFEKKEEKRREARDLCSKGYSLRKKGKIQESIEYFNQALEIVPGNSVAITHLGVIDVIKGNIEKGFDLINTATKNDPNNRDVWVGLGEAYEVIEDYNKAIKAYEKALELIPDNIGINAKLALAHGKNKNYSMAIELLENFLKPNPNNTVYLSGLGSVYMLMNDPNKALEYFIKSLEQRQFYNSPPYINIPIIHAEFGNFDAAIAYLKVGLKIYEDNELIEESVKKVYEKFNKPLNLNQFKQEL